LAAAGAGAADGLSPRETEVVKLIAEGSSNSRIGSR
jgi:DNA-binding CsgD family transcriptional regulator